MQPKLSILVPLLGEMSLLAEQSEELLDSLRRLALDAPADAVEVVVVADGHDWSELLTDWCSDNPGWAPRIIRSPDRTDNPALLLNLAATEARGDWCAFSWAGCSTGFRIAAWQKLIGAAQEKSAVLSVGLLSPAESKCYPHQSWLPPYGSQPGLVSLDLLAAFNYAPMSNCVVATEFIREKTPFCTDQAQRTVFWWKFTLSAWKEGLCFTEVSPPVVAFSWETFPFFRENNFEYSPLWEVTQQLSMPDADSERPISGSISESLEGTVSRLAGLRVLVINHAFNLNHIQIGFLNYFELLQPQCPIYWRTVLPDSCTTNDLVDADLVVFCRTTNLSCLRLLKLCRTMSIPSIYMLDDNFFELGTIKKQYNDYIAEGSNSHDLFLQSLAQSNCVLTYSDILAERILQYREDVFIMRTNINPDYFKKSAKQPGNEKKTVAYFGSERLLSEPFEGMKLAVQARKDVSAFILSSDLPEALSDLETGKVVFHGPIFDYKMYASAIAAVQPDVCIAPLRDTTFENSKCPLKYLEITACGAAGIYSDVPLYRETITHGENGLLTSNDPLSWRDAILEALDSSESRRASMVDSANENVMQTYSTQTNLSGFVRMLDCALHSPGRPGVYRFYE